MRWTSRENLLTAATDEDPQLFVSLYDFQAGGENQLSLRKTEQVRILSYNKSGEWCEAHNAQGNLYIVLEISPAGLILEFEMSVLRIVKSMAV